MSTGTTAGGGPIEDCLIERCTIYNPPNGFNAIRIAGNDEYASDGNYLRVPKNVLVTDCDFPDADLGTIDQRAAENGCRGENNRPNGYGIDPA